MTINTAARTLIFGGTGFIGGHVARRLRDHGAPVTVERAYNWFAQHGYL